MNKGFLIVLEGIDGSGKTTQINLLKQYLASQGWSLRTEVISFPMYESFYGQLIKRYLEGEFGSVNNVNSYLIAGTFASDRLLAKPQIEKWLSEGKIVLVNRYVSASKAHLGANLPDFQQEEFIKWVDEMEYKINKMPKEGLSILLKIDPKQGQENALKNHLKDIHEESVDHLTRAAKIYLQLSQTEGNWVIVDCMENGQMRTKESIAQEILRVVLSKLPVPYPDSA